MFLLRRMLMVSILILSWQQDAFGMQNTPTMRYTDEDLMFLKNDIIPSMLEHEQYGEAEDMLEEIARTFTLTEEQEEEIVLLQSQVTAKREQAARQSSHTNAPRVAPPPPTREDLASFMQSNQDYRNKTKPGENNPNQHETWNPYKKSGASDVTDELQEKLNRMRQRIEKRPE